jgi:hypothetical protein
MGIAATTNGTDQSGVTDAIRDFASADGKWYEVPGTLVMSSHRKACPENWGAGMAFVQCDRVIARVAAGRRSAAGSAGAARVFAPNVRAGEAGYLVAPAFDLAEPKANAGPRYMGSIPVGGTASP